MRRAQVRSVFLLPLALAIILSEASIAIAADSVATNASASTAAAQPAASPSPQPSPAAQLPPIVVTATRVEQPISEIGTTVTVVDSSQIESQQIDQVNDPLRQVPGVTVTQDGSPGTISSVSIRGASSDQTLVMIDGVEINSGASGDFDLANLTTDNMDRIEVLRGAGGALYGSQAMGGVINFISKEGQGPPQFTMLSEGGNRATQRQAETFSGSEGNFGYSGALSYFSTTGFRPINDSSDNLSGSTRLDYHLDDDTTVTGFARYTRANVSLVNYDNFEGPIDPTAHQRTEFMLYKGQIERHFGDRLTVRLSGSFVRNEIRLNNYPYTNPPPASDALESSDIPEETRGANLEAIYEWTKGIRTVAGFDFKDRWLRSGDNFAEPAFNYNSITVFHAERQEYAGYVEQEVSLLDGHILGTGGFRADGNSQFGEEVSPSWSVAIPIAPIATTLRGSYSEGFNAPSFDDLYYPDFGNPNLEPEISSEYDGGFTKTFGELASFTGTYFSRRVHNLIEPVPCTSSPGCETVANANRVDVQGFEAVPLVHLTHDLTLSGNFTFIDETHRPPPPPAPPLTPLDVRPIRVPKHSAAGLLQYIHDGLFMGNDTVIASLAYTFVGDRDDLDPTTDVIRNHVGYQKFDAVVSYSPGLRWGRIRNEEIYMRVQNLFDRNYSEAFGFKSPPINGVAGVKLDF
jgi:vitamin B12 transporter